MPRKSSRSGRKSKTKAENAESDRRPHNGISNDTKVERRRAQRDINRRVLPDGLNDTLG